MKINNSYNQIIKSTGIVGGAQVITIVIGIARSKIIAVLLGPMGVGVVGLYLSTIELVQSATGFGLGFSAVRDIAQAAGTNDRVRISRTILILRRWVWFTGIMGVIVTLIFCKPLSRYAFGDEKYAWGVAVLSVVLLMQALNAGQLALLQGLRQISTMARAKVLGVAAGFCITVPLYWFFGLGGIVPGILLSAAVSLFLSWLYSRRVPVEVVGVSVRETFHGGTGMVRLGFSMVITGVAATGVLYIVRGLISNRAGIQGVGQFQAAWNVSTIYLAAVLQAMGADFFPRLSAINQENEKVVRLVNEQTEVALLVAGPLIVGMLSFGGFFVPLLYSSEFVHTIGILNWQLVGTFLKVITWPIGFVILAKGRGVLFVATDLLWNSVYLSLVYFGWDLLRLEMTGVAFLISYLVMMIMVFIIVRHLTGFMWSVKCVTHIMVFGILVCLASVLSNVFLGAKVYWVGGLLTFTAAWYSCYGFSGIVGLKGALNKLTKRECEEKIMLR